MLKQRAAWRRYLFLGVLSASVAACGGEIVGVGNSDNRIVAGDAHQEVAELLAKSPGTPQVIDEMLSELFSAILGRANQGDPEAVLIVLRVAQEQRQEDEE